MQTVDIYIGTSLRGPAKGTGKSIYLMRSILENNKVYESKPSIAQFEDATESKLVLVALRDALQRFNYGCKLIVHTECYYIDSAVKNDWPKAWKEKDWVNSKGEPVKDAKIWQDVLDILTEAKHEMEVNPGKHEYSEWMQWQLSIQPALNSVFTLIKQE